MEELTCQKAIHMTNDWGKAGKRKCGKVAKKYIGDLPVCEHHYNKWVKKMSKKATVKESTDQTAADDYLDYLESQW